MTDMWRLGYVAVTLQQCDDYGRALRTSCSRSKPACFSSSSETLLPLPPRCWPACSTSRLRASLLALRSGSLQPGCVAPFRDGKQLARPSELGSGDPHEVLVYGPPGMHPGDLHKVHPYLPGYAIIVTPYVPVMR